MTQAFNLSLLANKVNTSGVVDSTALPTSGVTAGSYTVANVTVDDKGRVTAASSTTLPAGGFSNMQVFTSNGTFTVPAGVTKVKVTVVGGGGNGSSGFDNGEGFYVAGYGGGAGGAAIEVISGLSPGATISVTVGGINGTSSFGAYCSATGGTNAISNPNVFIFEAGSGGVGSGGNLNINGQGGGAGNNTYSNSSPGGTGGTSIMGGGGRAGTAGGNYGGGGGGDSASGGPGVVVVEW